MANASVTLPATTYYPFAGIVAVYPSRVDADYLIYSTPEPDINLKLIGIGWGWSSVMRVGRKGWYRIQATPFRGGQAGPVAETLLVVGGLKPPEYLWVVIVSNPATLNLAQGKVIGDLAYWRNVQRRGHRFRSLSIGDPLFGSLGFDVVLRNHGVSVPGVVLLAPDGAVRGVQALPATVSAMDECILKALVTP